MPRFLLTVSLPKVIQQLCTCALITDKTLQWAESRKNALTALSLVCTTVGIAPSSPEIKMTLEVADECNQKEIDVIGLGCSKESFTEHSEVEKLIDELRTSAQHQTNQTDIRLVERNWQRFSFILDQYQEQPHLIDSHLDGLLTKIINIIREEVLDYEVKHLAFRCLYFISKVRGYKVVAIHLPHETADLEPWLHYLENQDPGVQLKWETHYSLLLWLSLVVKIPFHLQRFDTSTSEPIMEGLIFLKPRVASWRYQRGSRSLAANLQQSQPVETKAAISVNDEDDHDYDVPEEIEEALRECLASADSNVQQSAISAVTALIGEYFRHQPVEKLTALLNHFLPEVTSNNQQARVGNALALGSMPRFLLTVSLPKVIQQLCTCALITDKTLQWAESRKNALTALSLVCTTVGIAPSSPGGVDQVTLAVIFRTFIDGFEDYTVDSRGDIGAIVRESAMSSIQLLTNTSQPELLEADLIRSVLHAVAKQSTEQIRRNRLLAPNVFSSLVYCSYTKFPHS
ncbi:hypothetical protein DAPPUDRAFT_270442 [Daphnia pulex]|uniref:Tubulin-specific chaperone D n=1 Tax=Daphnia pulex TaxID=6669 RepID=E9I0R4_DAPPU|nr:hypothetical protein DAPPUDRAFT_270442 [Daphnia pulex]|eukprot:EFX62416.1 hypothetical protein DAPPUDRAFT_270442 [Daphnia pulex]